MPPFAPLHLDHVVLRVTDLAKSRRFYTEVLGCRVAKERPGLGMLHLKAGAAMIDLVAVDGALGREGGKAPGREGRNVDHFCLRVTPFDADAMTAFLKAAGVPVDGSGRRFGAEGYGQSLYCRDPDGNRIELKGPPEAPPEAP